MKKPFLRYALVLALACSSNLFAANVTYDIVQLGLTDAEHTRTDGVRYNAARELNEAGQVIGLANRYNGNASMGQSAWLYNSNSTVQIGLTDAGHTHSTGSQYNDVQHLNEAGQVAGFAQRYIGSTSIGRSAWLYNGSSTVEIGLTGAGYTNSSDGYQYNIVSDLNEFGQMSGVAQRYNGSTSTGYSAWLYNGSSTVEIGLTGARYTNSSNGYQHNIASHLNEAGQVAGYVYSYSGSTLTGQSAWLYNGSSTVEIGLTGAGYTDSSNGYRENIASYLNEAGKVTGVAQRYNGSMFAGQSAWLYNGSSTVEIGLTGAGHTNSSDGYQSNDVQHLNEAGQVVGVAQRYNGSLFTGYSAWFYNGSNTVEIGLNSEVHTRTDGYQNNDAQHLNEAGHVAGRTSRYNGYTNMGQSVWLYNGSSTMEIGLTDAGHTRTDGHQYNVVQHLNEAGQLAGYAHRYNGSTYMGQSGWLYDGLLGQTTELVFSERSDGFAISDVGFLGDDGLVLGSYSLFDETDDTNLGTHIYLYTLDEGFFDLGALVSGGLDDAGWISLSEMIYANGAGYIVGNGMLADGNNGLYLVSPSAVPVPTAVWLFSSGLLGLIGVARRK